MSDKVSRRRFLKGLAAVAGGSVLAACAPQIVKETVVVQVPVEKKVIETVVVEKAIEKTVIETVVVTEERIVEKEVTQKFDLHLMSLKGVGWLKANEVLIADVEARTGNKVTLEEVQWPIRNALVPAIAAGTPPDVFHDMSKQISDLYGSDDVLTLDELLDASKWDVEDMIPASMDSLIWVNGKVKQVPLWHNSGVGFIGAYREDFFDEAGLPYPDKVDAYGSRGEMYEFSKKLQKTDAGGNVTRWGYDNRHTWTGMTVIGGILEQGGHWWDEAKQEFTLDTVEVANAIQTILLDPTFKYGCSPDLEHMPEQGRSSLAEGMVALDHVAWTIGIAEDQELEIANVMDYFELPGMGVGMARGGLEGTWGCGMVSGIPIERLPASFDLCTAQLEDEVAIAFAKWCGPLSARKDFLDSAIVADYYANGTTYNRCVVDTVRFEMTHDVVFWGWEWGDLGMGHYCENRCGGNLVDPAEVGQERCERTGRLLEGKVTAEQVAEEWQETATKVRKAFYAQYGIEV